ncbi:hypothetical protein N431DRAFT_453443 [Stipitochalara longipes BDJ]|nr:hypothetical protein N431DRAFT_453443 [Stipitochalara longipes BDJ]
MYTSITKFMALALLVTPLIAALEVGGGSGLERRYVGGNANLASLIVREDDLLEVRHHTEAQIAAKKAKTAGRALTEEEIEEDEDDALLTTLAPGGEIEARHHTEAQIAAKKAKAAGRDLPDLIARHHTGKFPLLSLTQLRNK